MIRAKQLTFSYTNRPFICSMSFDVREGEIFGFLGPLVRARAPCRRYSPGC